MIVVVGLSHRTAPIAVREGLALPRGELPGFLQELRRRPEVGEVIILSTCNRVELFAAGKTPDADLSALSAACAEALCEVAPSVGPHLYSLAGGAAVRHLFRVAASLDSLVLGEPQILGQVKEAFDRSRELRCLGPILNRTLPRALRVAKRVRNETRIGIGQVSVPSVAVDLTRQIFSELTDRTVLLVGSGEMAETVARQLRGGGARVVVAGRNLARAVEVARTVDGTARPLAELETALVEADVVVTSTSAPGFVVSYEAVAHARKKRRGQSQFFIDLAVPRDIDPRIEKLDSIFLYNVDDLSAVVERSLSARSREAESAEAIIASEADGYDRWADAEQATPTIVAFRNRMREGLELELGRSLRGRLRHLPAEDRAALGRMLDAAVNRLLHVPTVRLRQSASERSADARRLEQLASALDELFDLSGADDLSALDEGAIELRSGPAASSAPLATPPTSPVDPKIETKSDTHSEAS